MSRARLPRRVKDAQRSGRSPAQLRHWRLVRRYYLRLSAAVKRVESSSFAARCAAIPLVYRLDGHTPVPVVDVQAWAEELTRPDQHLQRQVGLDTVGPYRVSTVFLGYNTQWHPDAPPLVFETMVFDAAGPAYEQPTQRYGTWAEAAQGHAEVLAELRGTLSAPGPEGLQ